MLGSRRKCWPYSFFTARSMRWRVDHDRFPKLGGQPELGREEPTLVIARRVVAEPVEPRLAHRDRLWVLEQIAQRGDVVVRRRPCLVGVDPEDREYAVMPLRERKRAATVVDVGADREDARDARLGRAIDRLVRVVER